MIGTSVIKELIGHSRKELFIIILNSKSNINFPKTHVIDKKHCVKYRNFT